MQCAINFLNKLSRTTPASTTGKTCCMANINDTYFDGQYKDIWKALIPAEFTAKEVDFMMHYFNLQSGSRVLDLMCGYGRHAMGLAERGVEVTAVDNLSEYIEEIRTNAEVRGLPIEVQKQDVTSYEPTGMYDLVICMGNSLNFFDAENVQRIFQNVSTHLKADGHILINSWSIAEITFKHFVPNGWSQVGDVKFLTDSKILFRPTRIETTNYIIGGNGQTEIKEALDYIYSLNELAYMLTTAGLSFNEIFSVPGKRKFLIGDPRVYLIATKI
jgi:SAM-dependent methyltransferase